MDIGEGFCYGECCKVYKPGDSQACTTGANNTLCTYKKNFKKTKKKELWVELLETIELTMLIFVCVILCLFGISSSLK